MPGTILVSVLEFKDIPSSSPSSSISIKVCLGTRSEWQTWERRDFSIPLTTLRDSLIVLLQDSEGNVISQTGIETKSIVEKGLWDDFFPLTGGGFLHMKLQFILNEEERKRIRIMRESAVKKKHGKYINSSPISVQSTPSSGVNVASFLSLQNVISDTIKDTSSAITVQKRVDLSPTESGRGKLVDKMDAQQLPANVPTKAIHTSKPARFLRGSQSVPNLLKFQEDRSHNPEMQSQLSEKAARNVMKMINAFESGLAEDKSPHVKTAPTKFQPTKIKTSSSLKGLYLREDKEASIETAESISKGVVNPLPSERLHHDLTCSGSGEETSSLRVLGGTNSSDDTDIKSQFKPLHREVEIKEHELLKAARRYSAFETVSGRVLDEHRNQPSNLLHGKRDSDGHPVSGEIQQPEISFTNSREINIQGVPSLLCTPKANCKDRHDPFESSGGWIFPDETIRFCITTSGKKVMNLIGSCSMMKTNIEQERLSFSLPENVEDHQDNVQSFNDDEVNKTEKNQRPEKVNMVGNSEDTETSGTAVGQAIKVAIMIGFGALVVLTRQRRNR